MYFDPAAFLRDAATCQTRNSTALIVLNAPIESKDVLRKLWNHAFYKVAADGGANRLWLVDGLTPPEFKPDIIHGDLDSLAADVRELYERHGVEVSQDPDQYSTDFTKAINKIRGVSEERGHALENIIVIGSISGRVDQGIGLLHQMYKEFNTQHSCRFWLFSECSISFILPSGKSSVATKLEEGILERNIGILPIFGSSSITTNGLEWDVKDWPTDMGGNVSTSNHVEKDVVEVATTAPVLFTIEVRTDKAG